MAADAKNITEGLSGNGAWRVLIIQGQYANKGPSATTTKKDGTLPM